MKFEDLRDFISTKMRLSHIYQPLLIRSLIDAGGSATLRRSGAGLDGVTWPYNLHEN